MENSSLAKWWIAIAGVVLVAVGLLGFVSNPIVGESDGALLPTDAIHNVVHLATGLLALYIAFGLSGPALANGVLGFGVLYAAVFVAVLISPDLFGIFSVPANAAIHVVHAALAVVSLAVGYMARGSAEPMTS